MIAVQVESNESELAVHEKINPGRSAILRDEPRSAFSPLGQYNRTAFYCNQRTNQPLHFFTFCSLIYDYQSLRPRPAMTMIVGINYDVPNPRVASSGQTNGYGHNRRIKQ